MNSTTKKITTVGMLCGMAMVINLLIHFPIVPAVSYLSYDPKDIVIVIGGFIYGPFISFVMSAICSVLELMLRGGTILDVVMNMISTCMFACVAAGLYKKYHTKQGAIVGLLVGVIATTASMMVWNYIVTPIYYGMPKEAVVPLLLPGILPFNLIKYGLDAGVTLFLYKPVVTALRKSNLVEQSKGAINHGGTYALGGFIVVTLAVVVMSFQGII